MMSIDRRYGPRVPLETYVNTYVNEQHQRGFTLNISESGLFFNSLMQVPTPPGTPVGVELVLPERPDSLWIAGEVTHDAVDDYFLGRGVRFLAMAGAHARALNAYCRELRRRRWRAPRRQPA